MAAVLPGNLRLDSAPGRGAGGNGNEQHDKARPEWHAGAPHVNHLPRVTGDEASQPDSITGW
jgi:hypothetical protein